MFTEGIIIGACVFSAFTSQLCVNFQAFWQVYFSTIMKRAIFILAGWC